MKNTLDEISNRLNDTEEQIMGPEFRVLEINYAKEKKKNEKNDDSLRDF